MRRLSFPSFAKINWHLKILGRRPDGFHELVTVLQTIDWADRISLEVPDSPEISLQVAGRPVAQGEENLLVQAARLLQRHCKVVRGADVRLQKVLPVGGGLGGGSSNAATLLLFLNQLWECGLRSSELIDLAGELGSDVPFFLTGGMAAAGGKGADLTRLPDAGPESLLLLTPPVSIATQDAYRLGRWGPLQGPPELTKLRLDNTILRFRDKVERGECVRDLAENDFDGPLFAHFPLLARARRQLLDAGCERVIVSGSGSTLLGLASPERIVAAAERLSAAASGEVRVCRTLSRGQYWKTLEQSGLQLDNR